MALPAGQGLEVWPCTGSPVRMWGGQNHWQICMTLRTGLKDQSSKPREALGEGMWV